MQTANYFIADGEQILIDGFGAGKIMFIFDKHSDMRRKNVRNHVEFDDYFATLASILNCIKQDCEDMGKNRAEAISANKENLKRLENLKNDLLYLQDKFTIVRKKK